MTCMRVAFFQFFEKCNNGKIQILWPILKILNKLKLKWWKNTWTITINHFPIKMTPSKYFRYLQIIHANGNHWAVVSTIGSKAVQITEDIL